MCVSCSIDVAANQTQLWKWKSEGCAKLFSHQLCPRLAGVAFLCLLQSWACSAAVSGEQICRRTSPYLRQPPKNAPAPQAENTKCPCESVRVGAALVCSGGFEVSMLFYGAPLPLPGNPDWCFLTTVGVIKFWFFYSTVCSWKNSSFRFPGRAILTELWDVFGLNFKFQHVPHCKVLEQAFKENRNLF